MESKKVLDNFKSWLYKLKMKKHFDSENSNIQICYDWCNNKELNVFSLSLGISYFKSKRHCISIMLVFITFNIWI